ncbi:hypothetical protein QCA50_004960 [Cerrena zonata]|uniref:Uncharacterized protein n=1 Tax=Cerrena zonata TaxID=2478898 RepID=A0AAW0GPX6_9APHY
MFFKSLLAFAAAVLLSGVVAPAFALNEAEFVKRIVIPACSGDPSTPKPAFCSQLPKFMPGPGIHPVSFKREVEDLLSRQSSQIQMAKRIINIHCSGDPATIPADCFNTHPRTPGRIGGHIPFLESRDERLSGIELAKRNAGGPCVGALRTLGLCRDPPLHLGNGGARPLPIIG